MTTSATPGEHGEDLLDALVARLVDRGVPDALMLRRVLRLRELAQELDRELALLQRYYTAAGA